MTNVLTQDDRDHIAETAAELRAGQNDCEYCGGPCESDCYNSETVMTSTGYYEVYPDSDESLNEGTTVADLEGLQGRFIRIQNPCILTNSNGWRDFDPELDDMISLSWLETITDSEATPDDYYEPEHFGGSDYSGTLVERSNYEVFTESHADDQGLVLYHGEYGTFGVLVQVRHVSAEMIEEFAAVEAYPLLDDDAHSALEVEAQGEAWENWARCDFLRALRKLSDAFDDVDDTEIEEVLSAAFCEACETANEYWIDECEGVWIDVARVAAHVDLEELESQIKTVDE